MLTELHISGLGVIDDAVIEPHTGFTVVTGETGAGKTMVVTALGLLTGGRGDAGRVRVGVDRAVVEARIAGPLGDAALKTLDSVGGSTDDDGSVILVRSVGADGRSRGHIGGRAAPLSALAEISEPLIAVHGQSEAISLLRGGRQRAVLDRFAGSDAELAAYRTARIAWQQAVSDLADRTSHARERAQREQLLRLGVDEIGKVDPQPGEDVDLIAEVRRLENADALRSGAQQALQALTGESSPDEPNAVGLVEGARKVLEATSDERLTAAAAALHSVSAVVLDTASDLTSFLGDLDADPERLETLLNRQAVLRSLTRRYGADINAVLAWRAEAEAELRTLDSSEEALAQLRGRCAELAAATAAAAVALTKRRRKAAAELGERATAELAHLAMGRATLSVTVTQRAADPEASDGLKVGRSWVSAGVDGVDQVEFAMVAHAGAPLLPIAKGASGGELSRVMLAVEVVLAGADPVATMVFDEVDAGVGGRAATEIGRRLAMLATDHQVIVVTHLAQVAAFADRHYVVDAGPGDAVGSSAVHQVENAARELELARMLGGTDGASARAHASDLLTAAGSARPVGAGPSGRTAGKRAARTPG
ncbi:DNA replication and repair protein RecN [Nakamurella panacisegetis]|uniref:DNA repair protein RecN n=1 Tax=Nakamurella panacisegetis TaxID=1090615 RepID=A0A1H0PSS6_9ACTN|nr:DNA repair protein RecN [Nakamurella panacisegetis]SDP07599.1 DNA replication and repair protein RecN [Nakamurella panacisegetis]